MLHTSVIRFHRGRQLIVDKQPRMFYPFNSGLISGRRLLLDLFEIIFIIESFHSVVIRGQPTQWWSVTSWDSLYFLKASRTQCCETPYSSQICFTGTFIHHTLMNCDFGSSVIAFRPIINKNKCQIIPKCQLFNVIKQPCTKRNNSEPGTLSSAEPRQNPIV